MHFSIDNIILVGSLLLFISLLASKTTKYGIPTLVLFLIVGMLAGSDGPGGIYFNDPSIAKLIGVVALNFILFSGGLDTKWADIKPVFWQGVSLSTLGVIISTVVIGLIVNLVTQFTLLEGMLLGAIVSSTDAAAVFSILRSKTVGLKGNLRPLLELESGSNDPMAYFLTILFTFLLSHQNASVSAIVVMFLKQMIIGGLAGYLMGIVMVKLMNWIKLEVDGLYSVFLLSMMLLNFSFVSYMGGNGFLSVYISACILGNSEFVHRKSLIKHFDGQAWLMQIIMFVTLGLLVFPKQLFAYAGIGLLISAIIMFIARPVSVFLSLMFFKINTRNKLFLSWVGLRGAVPIILATYPLTAGVEKSNIIFNIVFFISISSVLLQGISIPYVAKLMHLSVPVKLRKQSSLDKELSTQLKTIIVETIIEPGYICIGKPIVDLHLPSSIMITIIEKPEKKFLVPDGNTILEQGDKLTVIAEDLNTLRDFYTHIGKI